MREPPNPQSPDGVAFRVDPQALYERKALARSLGLGEGAVKGCPSVRLGARVFILGDWFLAWLNDSEEWEDDGAAGPASTATEGTVGPT